MHCNICDIDKFIKVVLRYIPKWIIHTLFMSVMILHNALILYFNIYDKTVHYVHDFKVFSTGVWVPSPFFVLKQHNL